MLNMILQGIIQGLSEFLPISSSGHLTLFQHFTKIDLEANMTKEAIMTTDIALHFGTLIAVIYFFRKDIIPYFTKAGWQDASLRKIALLVIVGSIPTALIGFALKKQFEALFSNPIAVCCALFITGIVLLISEKIKNSNKESTPLPQLSYGKAVVTGIAQGIAITPGISRSGSTIAAGLLLGLKGEDAAKYSFLLMIVAVGGATLLEFIKVVKSGGLPPGLDLTSLIVGALTAMVVGFLSLKFLVYIINKQKLSYFAYYLFAVSIICFSLIQFAGM